MVLAVLLLLPVVTAGERTGSGAYVSVRSPADEEVVPNPVTFRVEAGGGVEKVSLFVDGLPIGDAIVSDGKGSLTHEFAGVNVLRRLTAEGYSQEGKLLVAESTTFVASEGYVPAPPGFNTFAMAAVNDLMRYPRDGTYPYCWRECPGSMGVTRDVRYQSELLWEGEGSCYCTGFTLELFLDAMERFRAARFMEDGESLGELSFDTVFGGEFYQHWQGFGAGADANSGAAFASAGIGYELPSEEWNKAAAGDFANISRSNGTGHAVVFISWVRKDGEIVGLTYYGCNRAGRSHPDTSDPDNVKPVSGPSFATEYFEGRGGHVLPQWVHIGHVVDPLLGL